VSQEYPEIVISERRIDEKTVRNLAAAWFGDMVKYVVDVELRLVAVGGQLHADAEALLLQRGSRQADLWGANYYPDRNEEDCIEPIALINIRPAQGNRSMEVQDTALRARVREITFELLGRGKGE
jgi:hypothetical protein